MEFNKENMRKIKELIVFVALVVVAIWNYQVVLEVLGYILGIIFPFIVGGAIAFVLNVPLSFIQKKLFSPKVTEKHKTLKKLARPLSLVLLLLLVIGALAVIILVVIPQVGDSLVQLGVSIKKFVPKVVAWGEDLFKNNQDLLNLFNEIEFDWAGIVDKGMATFNQGLNAVVSSTFWVAQKVISGITTFFIAFVFAIYILIQKEKLGIQVQKLFYAFLNKRHADRMMEIASLTYKAFSNFLTGQCLEAVILGSMFFIAMSIFKFPYALLVALVITVTAMIPIFGAFIGCALGAFLILMVNPMQAVGFIVMFLVLQQIEGNLIYPHVVGNSVGLPSIWVLVAVTVGGSLMGIVGMLIFIPLTSVIYTLLKVNVNKRLEKKEIKM
ncbi:AI-2E family transporter [Ohessyouella blattaphilus]|uniref:AI-2E family transporter n=1 Tax=Ohessyouella blattaphilus TaxID=2949333 RepID=A0ABT1ELH5_9FIRM|nr:AI-2E family transporter [Ohessyouella blattaphilus]MCP1111554.1 AI-2E family transporter [Ohessyouella blattaphilus]MCR8564948.1 AI-2E family transporter [Ohessyouella blattaphilus]